MKYILRKKMTAIIGYGFFLIGTIQANPMVTYLTKSGTPPTLSLQSCVNLCVNTGCNASIAAKTYDCFKGCSHHPNNTMNSCAQKQFSEFITDLQNQIQNLNQQNGQQNQQLINLMNQINVLQNSMAQAQNKIKSLRDKKATLKGANQILTNQLDTAQKRFVNDQLQLGQLTADLNKLLNENKDLTEELQNAQNDSAQQSADLSKAKKDLVQNQQKITKLEKQIFNLRAEMDELQDIFEEMARNMEEFTQDVNDIIPILKDRGAEISKAQQSLSEQIRAQTQLMRKLRKDLPDQIALKQEELDNFVKEAKEAIAANQEFLDIINGIIEQRKKEINQTSSNLDTVKSAILGHQ